MAIQPTKATLTATTGVSLQVWREQDLFHTIIQDELAPPQICLGVDLFEVVAELTGLDLADEEQNAEATSLAEDAKSQLAVASPAATGPASEDEDRSAETERGHGA